MIAPQTTWLVVSGVEKLSCGMPCAIAVDGSDAANADTPTGSLVDRTIVGRRGTASQPVTRTGR
jgi:hypothetical protein